VIRHLNQRAYDSEDGNWLEFVRRLRGRPFDRALSLNCGIGWLERDVVISEVAKEVVAIDFLADLLATARVGTQGLPIEYHQMDTNLAVFPDGPYDCIINHAAGHHLANLDRVFRASAALLPPEGWLLTWDYTGPHRNQYGERIWRAASRKWIAPLIFVRQCRIRTCQRCSPTDPTEAIHSELILATMDRYFLTEHFRRLGGPIAYLLLTHNQALFDAPNQSEMRSSIVLRRTNCMWRSIRKTVCSRSASPVRETVKVLTLSTRHGEREELDREAAAHAGDGRYYLFTTVAIGEYPDLAGRDSSGSTGGSEEPSAAAASTSLSVTGLAFARAVAARIPGGTRAGRAMRRLLRKLRGRL
jgi:SAM-dependent methyltransferase